MSIAERARTCHDQIVPIVWLIASLLLTVAELLTMSFVLVMFAAGALAAAAVAAVGFSLVWQALVFAAVSTIALGLVRPVAQRHLRQRGRDIPMGASAIENAIALVLEEVDADNGLVKIDGELWRARAYAANQAIPVGARVRVIEIRGATAMVWRDTNGAG
jgi:membrane protein implicated in regulation of membrane protease activity